MGLKSGQTRKGLRNLSTGVSAIPDSEADAKLVHRWILDDVNGTVEDSIGTADGTNNGVASVGGLWAGGSAGDGDGSGDYIDTTTWGAFGSSMDTDFAFAFSFQSTTTSLECLFASINSDSEGQNAIEVGIGRDTTGAIGFFLRDDADDGGNRNIVETSNAFNDGDPHRAVVNKTGNTAGDIDIWIDGSEVSVTIIEDTLESPPSFIDFNHTVPLFARNRRGTIDQFYDGVLDDVCVFDNSLTQSEIQSYSEPWGGTGNENGVTITEQSSSQLTSKGDWQGRPVLEDLSGGEWVMAYRDGSDHSSDDEVWHIRFSDDQGGTWTADDTDLSGSSVTGFPANPENSASEMIFIELSNGNLIAHLDIRNRSNSTRNGIVQLRSTDGGSTWTDEGKIDVSGATNDELVGAQDHFVHPDTGDIYISLFVDPGADMSMPYKSGISRSTNNGSSWDYLSDISSTSDGTNEPGIEYLGNDEIIAVLRDDDESVTYQSKSTDLGSSWGSLNTILDDVSGVFQRPRIRSDGLLTGGTYTDGPLWMVGRVRPGEDIAITWSEDDGESWETPHVFGTFDDAAYSDLLHRSSSEYYLATYRGTSSSADVYDYVFTTD